jgi:hypothetical protein
MREKIDNEDIEEFNNKLTKQTSEIIAEIRKNIITIN